MFIGEQRVFSGKGKHKKLVGFKFLFNGALNAGVAQSTGNYHVTQKQGKKVKVLPVKSAVDNPGNFSVTISVGGFKTGKAAKAIITGWPEPTGRQFPRSITGCSEHPPVIPGGVGPWLSHPGSPCSTPIAAEPRRVLAASASRTLSEGVF